MARINLFQSFDMTAATDFDDIRWGPGEEYLALGDGYRIEFDSPGYDRLSGFSMGRDGDPIFDIDDFNIWTGAFPAELRDDAFIETGNFEPFWRFIMSGADRITGARGADRVNGYGGNDVMDGFGGNDRLSGGRGADVVRGGTGADILWGNQGNDRLFGGMGRDTLAGGNGADRLHGGIGNDRLAGGGGNDILNGNQGADVLIGGSGRDILAGGMGPDVFVFGRGSGHDRITDFTDDSDRIRLTGPFDDMDDIRMTMQGDDTVIRFGANSVTLTGIGIDALDGSDFQFV